MEAKRARQRSSVFCLLAAAASFFFKLSSYQKSGDYAAYATGSRSLYSHSIKTSASLASPSTTHPGICLHMHMYIRMMMFGIKCRSLLSPAAFWWYVNHSSNHIQVVALCISHYPWYVLRIPELIRLSGGSESCIRITVQCSRAFGRK